MKTRQLAAASLAVLAGSAGLLAISGEVPGWRSGGSTMVLHTPLAPVGECGLPGPGPSRVLFLGDSNMAGERVGGADHAFPQLIGNQHGGGLTIVNLSRGGAVLHSGGAQGEGSQPADLVVIMFGGNDAAPRGFLTRKLRWNPDQFRDDMAALVRTWRERGSQVLVLAALPAGSAAMDHRIAPYRQAAREGAMAGGGCFRDPVAAFADAGPDGVFLKYDGLHLSAPGQQALAAWLSPLMRPVPPAHASPAQVADV